MARNLKNIKHSEDFYNFLVKLGDNRVKAGTSNVTINLCDIPDLIVKYFKTNNDKYLELVKMENQNDR